MMSETHGVKTCHQLARVLVRTSMTSPLPLDAELSLRDRMHTQ